jgi:hypothetical protein
MRAYDLRDGPPPELAGREAIYLLGVGGPEDESGVGDVSAFVWRCLLLERPGQPPALLGFTAMPRLMGFTRAVNGQRPFTVPTEAVRLTGADLPAAPLALLLDPESEAFLAAAAAGQLTVRHVPELSGSTA